MAITSVERVQEYIDLPAQEKHTSSKLALDSGWSPQRGNTIPARLRSLSTRLTTSTLGRHVHSETGTESGDLREDGIGEEYAFGCSLEIDRAG